jgi:putative sugar O-methyltransferase
MHNFKRSLNNSYFQWLPAGPTDNQFRNLFNFWHKHFGVCPVRIVAESQPMPALENFKSHSGDNPFLHVADYWQFYCFFVGLLWHFVTCHDPDKLHERLEEPEVGSPLPVRFHGKLISQDLAHSIYEHGNITSLSSTLPLPPCPWVLEIGAGYGRLAYVFHKARRCKYIIVDIPPARDVAQWYLPQALHDVRVFRYRPFATFSSVAEEFAAADICFLSPSQIEKLPDGCCDIGISISSLHEMTTAQITHYKMQFERLTKHLIYFEQWAKWTNPADQLALTKDDYLLGPDWEPVLDRSHPIQSDFVQLAFQRRQAARLNDEASKANEQLRKKSLEFISAFPEKPTHSSMTAGSGVVAATHPSLSAQGGDKRLRGSVGGSGQSG